jgi:ABC-type sugar transport system ATPase subunit
VEELLRIEHGEQDRSKSYRLRDYNLELYQGEILYVQGSSGSGIRGLYELLKGERPLTGGKLYIREHKVSDYSKRTVDQYKIYVISSDQDLITDMTVAENLEIVRRHSSSLKLYRKEEVEKRVDDFLSSEGMCIAASTFLWKLNREQLKKLSMLKAKMHGAELIVLDVTVENYEGKTGDEICKMIQKLRREGISFLILSEKYSAFAELADRIQILHQGRDLMEWHEINDLSRNLLKTHQIKEKETSIKDKKEILGLFDYEWMIERGIWDYLNCIFSDNEALWRETIAVEIPKPRQSLHRTVAVIPRESSEQLIRKLEIGDNIILTIPERISKSDYGYINKKLKANIVQQLYSLLEIDPSVTSIKNLNRVQRKILSAYRFEIAKPKVMIFESPYWGMDADETKQFRGYLRHLCNKNIRVICFSKSLEELQKDCKEILISHNGRDLERLNS